LGLSALSRLDRQNRGARGCVLHLLCDILVRDREGGPLVRASRLGKVMRQASPNGNARVVGGAMSASTVAMTAASKMAFALSSLPVVGFLAMSPR